MKAVPLYTPADNVLTTLPSLSISACEQRKALTLPARPSVYSQPVERKPRQARPLKVPAALQRQLPYAERAKLGAADGNTLGGPSQQHERVAVVLQPREQKVTDGDRGRLGGGGVS